MFNWNSFAKHFFAASLLCMELGAQDRPKDKIKNIEALAKQGQNSVIGISAYQRDPDVSVRLAATEALIQVGGVSAADALRTSSEDGSAEIQRLAVAGIVNFYKPGYVKQGTKAKIGAVSSKIMHSNDDQPVIDPFVTARPEDINAVRKVLLNSINRESKLQAANALGTLRASAALPDLYPLLRSKDDAMMLAALRAIETCGNKAAANETIFLVRDFNEKIQSQAIALNGIYRNEAALPDLTEVFMRGRTPKSRTAAFAALAMIASPQSKGAFELNLDNGDGPMRGLASEGLGRIGAKQLEARIKVIYKDEGSARARLGEAFALVKFGDLDMSSEFTPLTYLFNSLNSAIWSEYSRSYLKELSRDGLVRKELRGKVATATKSEKIGLARIFAAEGTSDDREALDALAHDRDADVSQEGIKAARTLSSKH